MYVTKGYQEKVNAADSKLRDVELIFFFFFLDCTSLNFLESQHVIDQEKSVIINRESTRNKKSSSLMVVL